MEAGGTECQLQIVTYTVHTIPAQPGLQEALSQSRPSTSLGKFQFIHSFIHSLSTLYVAGTVLGPRGLRYEQIRQNS